MYSGTTFGSVEFAIEIRRGSLIRQQLSTLRLSARQDWLKAEWESLDARPARNSRNS